MPESTFKTERAARLSALARAARLEHLDFLEHRVAGWLSLALHVVCGALEWWERDEPDRPLRGEIRSVLWKAALELDELRGAQGAQQGTRSK